ncbi:MAG TPA: DUF4178 domain-containing protein [Bacteroidia bacterium]|jgi:hypothetical protein
MLSAIVKRFNCPGCSVQTALSLSAPLYITCPACGITYHLDKENNTQESALKKRVLQPIQTIKLGATGNYLDKPFQIIGHIRSINNNAISNEWLMKFENGEEKWLVENAFSYFVFDAEGLVISYDLIRGKKVGGMITIKDQQYTIYDLAKQIEFQMDGQIPEDSFNDQPYFKYELIHSPSGEILSLCIFDKETIEAFKGRPVDITTLNLSTLTEFKTWI